MSYDIIVIGEKCNDIFVNGVVNRISPEAPVPVFEPNTTTIIDGMAGNVFNNIKALNPALKSKFISQEIPIKKTRFIDTTSGYILLRVDEDDQTLPCSVKSFFNDHQIIDDSTQAVVISDYNKGFLNELKIRMINKVSKAKNSNIFLDTKKILGRWSRDIDFVKINQKEYEMQLKHSSITDLLDCCKNLIVTNGEKGSTWINKSITVSTPVVEVRDVVGAGDTYLAAFVIKYIECNDVVESMTYANKAASIAVSKKGTVVVHKNEMI